MSYLGISVKEVISRINSDTNGWYLPAVQRPYVWGSRYENEKYICKLFDSILRGYPIGGLILWNTGEKVPYREFVSDYETGKIPRLVDIGLHDKKDKWLVYDGQQRLQTLYSCLKYTFNGKVLVCDLLFDMHGEHDPDETGFLFVPKNAKLGWNYVRMNKLFSSLPDQESEFEDEIESIAGDITSDQRRIVRKNLRQLWKVYVESDKHSLAYFPIKSDSEDEVNEIFERLNTGGMSLSLSDILLSRIKGRGRSYDFEERLQQTSKKIYDGTGKGYIFSAYNILQLLHLLVKGRVRVDPKNVTDDDLSRFTMIWEELELPLRSFFEDYIWGQYKINNAAIIPHKRALLPMLVYFYEIYGKGLRFRDLTSRNLRVLNQYFIKSQINDWNLQSYVDNFTHIIRSASANAGIEMFDFPCEAIEEKIEEKKKRAIDITEEGLMNYLWFSLKILTPSRIYQFEPDIRGRFSPEIDHIFPLGLKGGSEDYSKKVDVLWNMQPVKGDVNGYKSNHHPKLFFTDQARNRRGETIKGCKYILDYDFMPRQDNSGNVDFASPVWDEPEEFIRERKNLMLDYLRDYYGIQVE